RKPGRLLHHGPAPIGEVIGAARHACGFRRGPILGEFLVETVAAFGRLDPGEANARRAHAIPIDIALVFADVDTANLVIRRARGETLACDAARATAYEKRNAEPKKCAGREKATRKISHRGKSHVPARSNDSIIRNMSLKRQKNGRPAIIRSVWLTWRT